MISFSVLSRRGAKSFAVSGYPDRGDFLRAENPVFNLWYPGRKQRPSFRPLRPEHDFYIYRRSAKNSRGAGPIPRGWDSRMVARWYILPAKCRLETARPHRWMVPGGRYRGADQEKFHRPRNPANESIRLGRGYYGKPRREFPHKLHRGRCCKGYFHYSHEGRHQG